MDSPVVLGGLGGSELILVAAIVLLLAGVGRLTGIRRARSTEARPSPVQAPSRAYVDRLLGTALSGVLVRRAAKDGA